MASPLRPPAAIDVERREDRCIVRARCAVERDAPYMSGHFPGFVVFPGVFSLEAVVRAVVQAGACEDLRAPRLRTVRSMRFVAPVLEGDTLEVEATVTPIAGGRGYAVDARCRRADGSDAARIKLTIGEGDDA